MSALNRFADRLASSSFSSFCLNFCVLAVYGIILLSLFWVVHTIDNL